MQMSKSMRKCQNFEKLNRISGNEDEIKFQENEHEIKFQDNEFINRTV